MTHHHVGQRTHKTVPSSHIVLLDSTALGDVLLIGYRDSQVILQCLSVLLIFHENNLAIQRFSIMAKRKHLSKAHIKNNTLIKIAMRWDFKIIVSLKDTDLAINSD